MFKCMITECGDNQETIPNLPCSECWTLIEKIGCGGFGTVYRAKDHRDEMSEAAVKVIRKCELNINQKEHVLQEVRIMSQLHHENIVKFISFSESEEHYFIVLELCPGGDLFDQLVRLIYFSEESTRHIIIQVGKALQYLHEAKDIIHGDIKLENILFYPEFRLLAANATRNTITEVKDVDIEFTGIGQIKLTDFGLSGVLSNHAETEASSTLSHPAPDIVKTDQTSKSVDMWGLGYVLYTLLCGFAPFHHADAEIRKGNIARGEFSFLSPWWDEISDLAKDAVSSLLTANQARRYTITEFLNHPWVRDQA